MVSNPHFNFFESTAEQRLYEDLVIEQIRMFAHDMFYMPRTLGSRDDIFNEDNLSEYNDAFLLDFYIKNTEGFEGEGAFLSQFNLQINDEITFTVARRTWEEDVGNPHAQNRPKEGDLIYMPLNGKIYQIHYVDYKPFFYQFGTLFTYDLKCQLFVYNNEKFNTGIKEIDDLEDEWSINVGQSNNATLYANGDLNIDANTGRVRNVTNNYILDSSDNDEIETEGDTIIDFTERDPFSEDGTF